jgi:hypothetical protein
MHQHFTQTYLLPPDNQMTNKSGNTLKEKKMVRGKFTVNSNNRHGRKGNIFDYLILKKKNYFGHSSHYCHKRAAADWKF